MARDPSVEDEYGYGGSGGTPSTPAPVDESSWLPGLGIDVGQIIEPVVPNGFYYVATVAGTTGGTEPAWPTTPGATVTDGTVTWEAHAKTSITWTAVPLYESGAIEPAWPVTFGGTVNDGTTTWTAKTNAITDAKCPHTRTAIKMANKIFAPYRDVLRFCATDDPTDWSTADDAGFLAVGLNASDSPEPVVLGSYRGRLVVFTASDLQLWTVDPDPAEMALYDKLPGLGSVHDKAAVSVGNDLYYLTNQGVRSLSLSASSNNLGGTDVGSGIDDLIVAQLAGTYEPTASYFPGNGQAWWAFGNNVYVYTKSPLGKVGAWSRYTFPWPVTRMFQFRGNLVLRAGDHFYSLDDAVTHDDGVTFDGVVWTPYLDMGAPGMDKLLVGADIVGYGSCAFQVGWDQNDTTLYTDAVTIGPDSAPGPGVIPMAVGAPSMAFKLTFAGGQAWQLNALNVYLEDGTTG